jgi:hypothetical protein
MSSFSRRFQKKVLSLGLNLAVQVAAAEATLLLHGPEAPPSAGAPHEVSREQFADPTSPDERTAEGEPHRWKGRAQRQLKTASKGLGLARLQLQAGLTEDAQATLDTLHEEMQTLRRQLDEERQPSPCSTSVPVLFHPSFLQ